MTVLIYCVVASFAAAPAFAQEQESAIAAEVAKLDYLVGEWSTRSTIVRSGEEAPGELSYRKVLGGNWILCTFRGQHPTRPVWEAYAMITWDPEAGHYRSYAFFGPGEPSRYAGVWSGEDTVTFTNEAAREGGTRDRISYARLPDGTVFQLNEVSDGRGNWTPTLRTRYAPREARKGK